MWHTGKAPHFINNEKKKALYSEGTTWNTNITANTL